MPKEAWSKKVGLDLRWDKSKILREALENEGKGSKDVPKVKNAQIHICKENYIRNKSDGSQCHEKLKRRIMRKLTKLPQLPLELRGKRLRKIEGMVYYVLNTNGCFSDSEADKIVDTYMICRERSNPKHHPLQSTFISSRAYRPRENMSTNDRASSVTIFCDPTLRRALGKRGYHVNIGPFSSAESLTLMKNFEKFLRKHDKLTDRKSIWSLFQDGFQAFFHQTRMFIYIGRNLNRASSQLYVRLFTLYHPFLNGKSDAQTDAFILKRVPELAHKRKKYKIIGEEIDRFPAFARERHYKLLRQETGINGKRRKALIQLIAELQNCDVKDIDSSKIPFAKLAAKFVVNEDNLRAFWQREGRRLCARVALPIWRLEDSVALLDAIESYGEEDENCIDFREIYARSFRGKVADWEHLREHYNRVRRVVPFYMLEDLPSTLASAKKELRKKLEERQEETQESDEDEDTFVE